MPVVELPDGRKLEKRVFNGNYNNTGVMRSLPCGASMIDIGNAEADLGEPISVDLRARFPRGSNIQPWLFGNWYTSPYRDMRPFLVGLGVRLGIGPWLEEAEGNRIVNDTIHVDIKGTYLCVSLLFCYFVFSRCILNNVISNDDLSSLPLVGTKALTSKRRIRTDDGVYLEQSDNIF